MSRIAQTLVASAVISTMLSGMSMTQDMRLLQNRQTLDQEIAGYMADGDFSALIDAIAPPSRMTVGRIRLLEQALGDEIPSLRQAVPIFRSEIAGTVIREVMAWWDEETYVYLGLLTHARADGLAVLDFVLTSDIRKASHWYLNGSNQ
ncbi:MAG: hypothetical protein JXR14_05235 [Paracoccaceae bacterium]